MTSLPPSSTAPAEPQQQNEPQSKPALIRAGRLAGRAVIAAWLISVLYHVVLFAGMFAIRWATGWAEAQPSSPPPFTAIVGDVDVPDSQLSPFPQPIQEAPLDTTDRLRFQPVPSAVAGLMNSGMIPAIGAPRGNGSPGAPGPGSDLNILGIGTGGGGESGFNAGMPLGGGGPKFFGLGGEARGARHIVYVVDRSGSMLNTFVGVVKELRESIGALRRSQKFHVIFFNSGPPLENPPRRLVSAISAHKEAAFKFLGEISPAGATDPRPALRRAFAVEPDLIYFLTDGEFDEFASSLFTMLDNVNRQRKVRIFTIAYVNQAGGAVLERIAREHNGEYRFVSEDEIF